ncbi:MAG: putative sulfate exporter family transporter [Parasphingorhabdus sp.]
MNVPERKLPMAADLFGELQLSEPDKKKSIFSYLPGLTFVLVVALAALWLSEHYGAPAILMGLLIGLALNFVNRDERLAAGLNLSSQTLLRWGIVLIGTQITFSQIIGLGIAPFLALVGIMVAVIFSGVLTARFLSQDFRFGLLAGGATAICGASAALAIWGLIGERKVNQSQFTIVLLGITIASAFAMTFYPTIASYLGLNDQQAGFLIGASIHDVAQSIGGGFSFSTEAGEVATIVKLSRVTLLAPVLILIALALGSRKEADGDSKNKIGLRNSIPWFVVGFLLLAGVNSYHPFPEQLSELTDRFARMLLLMAVIAAAVKSNMSGLLSHGWRSFGPVIATTLVSFVLALLAAYFI